MSRTRRVLGLGACAVTLAACGGGDRGRDMAGEETTGESAEAVLSIDADVVRFLDQASFGPTPADVAAITAHGGSAGGGYAWWIADQLAQPKTHYNADDKCGPGHPGITCVRDQFFDHAVKAKDQLRQRVAFALSEILVTSLVKLKSDAWMAPYQNLLVDNALEDFGLLLQGVAESAAMGQYLDNANNFVVDQNGAMVAPNENFARELMQLFTIGLCDLASNGTPKNGVCTSPYAQDDVESYAHLMSGWTFDTTAGTGACPAAGKPRTNGSLTLPMIACDADHEPQANAADFPLLKTYGTAGARYLTGTTWTARQALENPLDTASHTSGVIDELFHHPNVGPFIGKQLIQRLVTSNPSNAYVGRVTAVFNNDGTGMRGNLGAVVTAILTDTEARDTTPVNRFGRLREPALYVAGLARLLGVPDTTGLTTVSGVTSFTGVVQTGLKYDTATPPNLTGTVGHGLRDASASMGQDVFFSPSVFNYFPPDYAIPTTLLGGATATLSPELAIEDTNTIFERANFVDDLLYYKPKVMLAQALDLSALPGTAQGIVDWCNAYMMHNAMPPAMSTTILGALNGLTGDALKQRAIYLVATSSQYQVAR